MRTIIFVGLFKPEFSRCSLNHAISSGSTPGSRKWYPSFLMVLPHNRKFKSIQVGALINAQYRIDSRSCKSFFRGFPFADLDAMQLAPAFTVEMEVLLG